MTEPLTPNDSRIAEVLEAAYGLRGVKRTTLDGGADYNARKYRVQTQTGPLYFLKVRGGNPDAVALTILTFLREQGVARVLAPITTRTGRLDAEHNGFVFHLYTFIEGQNGWKTTLTPTQWRGLGALLKSIHSLAVPPGIAALVRRGDYADHWRVQVRHFLQEAESSRLHNPVTVGLANLLREKQYEITRIVERAEQSAAVMQSRTMEMVCCHGDLHAGNVLIAATGDLFIVDWDSPVIAPKERDLMFIGGGIGDVWNDAEEEAHFYGGYGDVTVDPEAIAYYRNERIVEDIAVFCQQIFDAEGSEAERQEALGFVVGQFAPGSVVEIARQSYERLR